MMKWMIWFEDEKPTVRLYRSENELIFVGDFLLEEILAQTGEEPVIGFFPTEHVSFIQSDLPKTSEKKIRLALPSLVEESIASNPEENFYALPILYQSGHSCTIAVTSLTYLGKIFAQIQAAGLNLQVLSPDCFLLKTPVDELHKLIINDRVVVRSAAYQGFSMHKHHAVLIMQELDNIPISAASLSEPSPYNFLQAQFAIKPPKKSFGKKQMLAAAVGAVLAIHFSALLILGSILNNRLTLLKNKSLELYAEVFPGAVKVNSPKSLIERELKTFSGRSQDPFMNLVATASEALSNIPDAKLEKMNYSQKGLSLHLVLPNMEALDHLSQFKQQQVTEQNNTVSVEILMAPGESS
jgi:type II secretion system protein L